MGDASLSAALTAMIEAFDPPSRDPSIEVEQLASEAARGHAQAIERLQRSSDAVRTAAGRLIDQLAQSR